MFSSRMWRLTGHIALVLVAAVGAAGCGGGTSSDDPPWGLTSIEMPRSDAELTAVFAALPDEIDGYPRSSGGLSALYGEVDSDGFAIYPLGLIDTVSREDIRTAGPPGTDWTFLDWLTSIASSSDSPPLEASDLDPDEELIWVASGESYGPDGEGIFFIRWAQPDGERLFIAQAFTEIGRRRLVEEFVDAVASTAGGAAVAPVAPTSSTRSTDPTTVASDATTTTSITEVAPAGEETEIEGVAADEPEIFLAEINALRESAAVGRIVGFINLTEPDRTWPLHETQPYCAGASDFEDIYPGSLVAINHSGTSEPPTIAVLRGSVFDGHKGCGMWFGAEVADADSYIITIGGHTAAYTASQLSATGWTVELWSSADVLESFCEEDFNAETCSRSMVLELSP